jgi:hypothetical protein
MHEKHVLRTSSSKISTASKYKYITAVIALKKYAVWAENKIN